MKNSHGAVAFFLAVFVANACDTGTCGAEEKPAKPEWKALFDGKTLKGWKKSDFFKPGEVTVKDGCMVLEKGDAMTGITYAGKDFPTTNYEVTLEGKRVTGQDFFCTTTFPVGKEFCSFVVGGWGGSTIGLSNINGADASENLTNGSKVFKDDQFYRFRIRVTDTKINVWIDDEQVVDLKRKGFEFSIRIECDESKPFGIATWRTVGMVKNIKVRTLTAEEVKGDK
ncbi:MAG: DUF1080 domain-containing protein [Zavarzinella sp.]